MVTNSDNSLAARRHMMTLVMQETIATLCRNMLTFEAELCVEGLLGITLDKTDVILLNIKQVIPMASMQMLLSDEANNSVRHIGCEDQGHNPSTEITLCGEVQSRARQLNNSFGKEHSTENSCPPLDHKDAAVKRKLQVSETDLVSEERLGSERHGGNRTENCDLEARITNDPKSSQVEDCGLLDTESCSDLLTRTRKWKEKLDHLNVECMAQPWNNTQIKQEHLDNLVETACELSGYAPQDTASFDLGCQQNFQLCRERSASNQSKWLNFSSSDRSGFNNSHLIDPSNSAYGLSADNHGDLGHQCTMCTMTFTTRHHLKRHINAIHSRSPLLSHCPICSKSFRRTDTMKRHCRSVHYKELGFGALDMMQFASVDAD